MAEESFSSLMALVDSHLSQTKLQNNNPGTSNFVLPNLMGNNVNLPTPSHRFIIPVLNPDRGPVTNNVLAEQVANTIRAKELQLQLENKIKTEMIIEEDCKNETQDDYEIDLTSALNDISFNKPLINNDITMTKSIEEDNFEISFKDCDIIESPGMPMSESPLTVVLDTYKIKRKRVSDFGKVFCMRYRPFAAPYIRDKVIYDSIERFDFSLPSPDDLIKEKMKKYQGVDILTYYGLEVSESLQRQK